MCVLRAGGADIDVSTRLVCTDGRVCTEHFRLKDGMPVRQECPSRGGEKYGLPDRCERIGDECRCH